MCFESVDFFGLVFTRAGKHETCSRMVQNGVFGVIKKSVHKEAGNKFSQECPFPFFSWCQDFNPDTYSPLFIKVICIIT